MTRLCMLALMIGAFGCSFAHAGAKPLSAPHPYEDVKPPVFTFTPAKETDIRALLVLEPSDKPLVTENSSPGARTDR